MNLRTLVLAKNYMPVSCFPTIFTVNVQDSIKHYLEDKVEVLSFYDKPILFKGEPIEHPTKGILYWPSVVVDRNKKVRDAVRLTKSVLYYREKGKCFYCKAHFENVNDVTKDHIYPKSKGGSDDFTNVVACCKECNSQKGDSMPVGKWSIKDKKVERPSFFSILEERMKYPIQVDDENWLQFLPKWSGEVVMRSDL